MKVTRKRYERCMKKMVELERCHQYVEKWEYGMKTMESVGDMIVSAFEIDEEGNVSNISVESPLIENAANRKDT